VCVKVGRTFRARGFNGSDRGVHSHRLVRSADNEAERSERPSLTLRDDNVPLFESRETRSLNGNGVGARRPDGRSSGVGHKAGDDGSQMGEGRHLPKRRRKRPKGGTCNVSDPVRLREIAGAVLAQESMTCGLVPGEDVAKSI
jgi:hypothetical protein